MENGQRWGEGRVEVIIRVGNPLYRRVSIGKSSRMRAVRRENESEGEGWYEVAYQGWPSDKTHVKTHSLPSAEEQGAVVGHRHTPPQYCTFRLGANKTRVEVVHSFWQMC